MARRRAGAFAPIWVAPQKFSGFCPKDQIQFWSFRGQGSFFLARKGPGRKELTPWQTKAFLTRSTCPKTKCRARGTMSAPESSHAIRVAIDEAIKCRETGEAKTIVFGLTGTGYFDMAAYEKFHNGEMSDFIPTDAQLAESFATLPQVPGLDD